MAFLELSWGGICSFLQWVWLVERGNANKEHVTCSKWNPVKNTPKCDFRLPCSKLCASNSNIYEADCAAKWKFAKSGSLCWRNNVSHPFSSWFRIQIKHKKYRRKRLLWFYYSSMHMVPAYNYICHVRHRKYVRLTKVTESTLWTSRMLFLEVPPVFIPRAKLSSQDFCIVSSSSTGTTFLSGFSIIIGHFCRWDFGYTENGSRTDRWKIIRVVQSSHNVNVWFQRRSEMRIVTTWH